MKLIILTDLWFSKTIYFGECQCESNVIQMLIYYLCSGNKWLQQQIPACRPVFSATHVSIGFVIIGLIFLAMGIAFTVISVRVSLVL